VNPDIATRSPRYLQLRDELGAQIASGELTPGALLPSEGDLARRCGLSRLTVRKALSLLRDDGLLTSRQGFGWSVTGSPMRQSLNALMSIDEQIAKTGHRPSRRLLTFAFRTPPSAVREALDVVSVLHIARLNMADDEPVGRNSAWVPEELARGLSIEKVENDSLHHLLPVTLGSATQTITAESASADDAGLLGVVDGAPLLRFNRTTYDQKGRAVLYSEAVYNPLRTEFIIELAPATDSLRVELHAV
jgi:GntR family transcriptional regulator